MTSFKLQDIIGLERRGAGGVGRHRDNAYDGKEETDIEPGRLYLHDSITPHEAVAYRDNAYQFFIAFEPNEQLLHSALY